MLLTLERKIQDLYNNRVIYDGQEGWYRELRSNKTIGIVATAQVLIALRSNGFDLGKLYRALNTLVSFALPDGSFPFVSNVNKVGVVDATAWSCLALSKCNTEVVNFDATINNSLTWLIDSQNDDGGWGLVKNSPSRIVSTTVALRAISSISLRTSELTTAFHRGVRYVLGSAMQSGGWPDQYGRECLGSTAYALILLSETEHRNSNIITRGVDYSLRKIGGATSWDTCLNREEVSVTEEGSPRRITFHYPLTHLFVRAIVANGHAQKLPSKVIDEYTKRTTGGSHFVGDTTDHGKDTSYGAHDTIMAIGELNKSPEYLAPSIKSYNKYDDINSDNYPQLYQVSGDSQSEIDIVFVHGLGGDARQTWLNKKTGFYLPTKISEETKTRVFSLGYANPPVRIIGKGMSLEERANNLLHLLETNNIFKRKTILIGHSFGGLIIKKILLSLKLRSNPENFQSIVGVVFLATPHLGSRLANFLYLSQFLLGPEPVRSLFYNDKELVILNREYHRLATHHKISHRSYGENSNLTIVNKKSSNPNIPSCEHIVVDASHTNICKPSGKSEIVFKSMCDFVKGVTLHG
jgi:pimeloyl-ACP methyl ester carboxylesterase